MKRIIIAGLLVVISFAAFAQEEKEEESEGERGFKKGNLFSGGSLNLSFFNGATVLGGTPQLGYSVASWLDAGITFGFTYSSQRDDYNNKFRQTIYGPGAFVRLFPVSFLFASAQYEHNFIRQKAISYTGLSDVYKYNVGSLLLGLGYSSGRYGRNSPYYYFSVSVDVLNKIGSPYNDRYNNILPVVNAGFNVPLFQGRGRRY